MFGRLEELVREIAVDVLEVVAHGHEMTVCESREQKPELRLVRLEPADLLMLKKVGPDNRGSKSFLPAARSLAYVVKDR